MNAKLYDNVAVHGPQGEAEETENAVDTDNDPNKSEPTLTTNNNKNKCISATEVKDEAITAVSLHLRRQRKTAKAYACTNCMEFFAELSVAYHWKEDEVTEYNKWYPFNRHQLQQHDPKTVHILDKYWTQFEE